MGIQGGVSQALMTPILKSQQFLTGIHAFGGGLTTSAMTQGVLYASAFAVDKLTPIDQIGVEVTTFGASAHAHLAIATFDLTTPWKVTVVPGTDSGVLDCGSNGYKSGTIAATLLPGVSYALLGICDVSMTVRGYSNGRSVMGQTSGTDTTLRMGLSLSQAYATLSGSYTLTATTNTQPLIMLRRV